MTGWCKVTVMRQFREQQLRLPVEVVVTRQVSSFLQSCRISDVILDFFILVCGRFEHALKYFIDFKLQTLIKLRKKIFCKFLCKFIEVLEMI